MDSFGKNFDMLVDEFSEVVPLKVKFKDEAWEMQVLYIFIFWFNPEFLTRYTTVIGNTIYFPDRSYIQQHEGGAMKTLAHEVVHILDADRQGMGPFALAYLFPQFLTLGVVFFPFLGFWALIFLLFALPWPAPFRAEYEARAYALDLLMTPKEIREEELDRICSLFRSWDYYRMSSDESYTRERILHWMAAAESGKAPILTKILLIYEMVRES